MSGRRRVMSDEQGFMAGLAGGVLVWVIVMGIVRVGGDEPFMAGLAAGALVSMVGTIIWVAVGR